MEHIWSKIFLVLSIIATVLLIVGVASPEWLSMNGHYEGIWIYCYYLLHTDAKRKCIPLDKLGGFDETGRWLQAVRVVMIISSVLSFCTVVNHMVYIVIRRRTVGLRILRVSIVLAVVSALLCMTGLIIYTTRVWTGFLKGNYMLSWSFILCAVGGGVMTLMLIPMLLEIRKCRVLVLYEAIS